MRLRAQVKHVRLVRRLREVTHQIVDRRLVRQVGEDDSQPAAQVSDVVQRPGGGGSHEGDHVRVEMDERLGQVGAHEAVRSRDEHGAAGVGIAELAAQSVELSFGPGRCIVAEHGWRVIVHAVRGLFAAVC